MLTLFAYIRKSVYKDPRAVSPEMQRAAIQQWADRNGPFAIEWFEDLGLSGRFEANREGWQALLQRLDENNPAVYGIAVYNYTKTHRNVVHYLKFYDDRIAPLGKRLVDVSNPSLDLATANGRMLGSIQMAVAEAHSRQTSENIIEAIHHVQAVKGRHYGPTPFGCDRDPDTYHLIPSAKFYYLDVSSGDTRPGQGDPPPGYEQRYYHDALIAAAGLIDGSRSFAECAALLNAAGWRFWTRDKSEPILFNRQQVLGIARHHALYAGELPAPPTGPTRRPDLPGGHQPILPVEVAAAMGGGWRARHSVHSGRPFGGGVRSYLLTGIIYCGACGERLHGCADALRSGGEVRRYRHTYATGKICPERSVRCEIIDNQVLDAMQEFIGYGEIIARASRELRTVYTMAALDDQGEGATLAGKQREEERLIDLYQDGLISKEQFVSRQAAIKADIARLQQQLDATLGYNPADIAALAERVAYLPLDVRAADLALVREMVLGVFARLDIAGQRVSGCQVQPWVKPIIKAQQLSDKLRLNEQFALILLDWLAA